MDMDRRTTRIPRPPGPSQGQTSQDRQPLQERGDSNRKRRGPSPNKPAAKRSASVTRTKAPSGKAAESANKPAAAITPAAASGPLADENWEQISQELGWGPQDCLNHKLTFKKKEDIKTTKDTLLQHVKRLRALGWNLLTINEKNEHEVKVVKGAIQQEEKSHEDDVTNLRVCIEELERSNASHLRELDAVRTDLSGSQTRCQNLEKCKADQENQIQALQREKLHLEAEQSRQQKQIAESQQQVASVSDLHQQAQKYNSQLQEYNTKLQADLQSSSNECKRLNEERNARTEEEASLRGTIRALEAQLSSAQAAVSTAVEGRQQANEDASRLRTEVEKVTRQRDELQIDLTQQREELSRYKETTGKSVETLEKEKASKAKLESQNKAQVEFNCELQDEVAQLRAQLSMSQTTGERQAQKVTEIDTRRKQLEALLEAAELRVREGEVMRRKLHNTILELKGNIRVFCRVRPLTLDNLMSEVVDGKSIVQFPTAGDIAGQSLELALTNGSNPAGNHKFSFDRVFGPASQQEEVFEEISQLVQSALDGYKVCIFAYGQTGSGKTYTMVGPPDIQNRGVIPRAVHQLFEASRSMEDQGWSFEMKASMMEIYNEDVKDLLGKGPPSGKKHQISHDDKGCTSVTFVESVDCRRPEKVKDLLAKATRMRSVGATAANEQSSRSHMVFTMTITGSNEVNNQQINGVLNLIDLAGSERLSKSLATGERLKETQAINKSLSALGDVIMALGNKESHVPYRNSKLTYLLQPCLGGDAKTLMFVNIAPTAEAANESLCSLRFAAKVNATEIGTARRNISTK